MTFVAHGEGLTASLLEMLSYRRPGGSKTERRWIREFIEPLGVTRDAAGNLYKRIGSAPVLWSAHTDTVHKIGGKQHVRFIHGRATVADIKSNCLGADNTAGVWLLREMILAGVPGLYVFHRDEETGGRGSDYMARNGASLFSGIRAAIAFDRRGLSSVITHQTTGRTCSDAFARSLAGALGVASSGALTTMHPDDGGTFTDTANYTDLIGECTNVSVGFDNEHRATESLNVDHVLDLRAALLKLDVSSLVFQREPGDIDPDDWRTGGRWDDCRYSESEFRAEQVGGWPSLDDDASSWSWGQPRTLSGILKKHPEEIADYLEECGFSVDDLLHAVYQRRAY